MKVVVFSDVHGNFTALEAVLIDIARISPDMIIFAGDLCMFGPRPLACVQQIQARPDIISLYGNTDVWLSKPPKHRDQEDEGRRKQVENIQKTAAWTRAELFDDAIDWIEQLPFKFTIGPTNNPADDCLIVHANPKDVMRPIFPPPERVKEMSGPGQPEQGDEELTVLFDGVEAGLIAFGHVHFPNVRRWREKSLANISAVSLPLDNDPRAKYGVLTWSDGRWSVEHRYVSYDVAAEHSFLAEAKPPDWQALISRLGG